MTHFIAIFGGYAEAKNIGQFIVSKHRAHFYSGPSASAGEIRVFSERSKKMLRNIIRKTKKKFPEAQMVIKN